MAKRGERLPGQEPGGGDDRLSLRGMRERGLTRADAAIVRAELVVTRQRWVIDATTSAGRDTAAHLELLAGAPPRSPARLAATPLGRFLTRS